VFTKEECQRGYQRALAVCMAHGWDRYARFYRHIRSYYRRQEED
jgi:hypothetical protein